MGRVNLGNIVAEHKGNRPKRQIVEWTTEAREEVPTVAGGEPIVIERTIRPDGEVRNIRIQRGRSRVNVDIESAHLIAYTIKDLSQGYVPEKLTEEYILKSNEVISEESSTE